MSLFVFQNPVEEKALTKMVMAFYQKLMYVCEARLTMAAKSLTDYIENKLKSALEFDPETGQPFLALEDRVMAHSWAVLIKLFVSEIDFELRACFSH